VVYAGLVSWYAVAFSQTRCRAPAEPAVVVLAAVAIDAVIPRRPAGPSAEGDGHRPAEEEPLTASVPE
jgi:hypothetical protein